MTQPTRGFYTPPNTDAILPHVKINCQEGRVWRVDRTQTPQGWQSTEIDITPTFRFVPDFTHMEVGFIRFSDPGVDFQVQPYDAWVAAGRPRTPPEGYKFGFRVPILLTKECRQEENDVRYLAHTSRGVSEAISTQFAEYQRRTEANTGMAVLLPVIALKSFEKKLRGQFRNFEPVLVAGDKWIERPDIFDEKLSPQEIEDEDIAPDESDLPF